MNILKNIKKHLGISRIIFLIGSTIGFFALYLNVRVLAYISIVFCGISLLINKDGNINW